MTQMDDDDIERQCKLDTILKYKLIMDTNVGG